jgi:protein-disulfide isomerase
MSTSPTKKERREAARQARMEREAVEAAAARRKRRTTQLLAALGAAVAIVVVAIVISSGGGDKASSGAAGGGDLAGRQETVAMLDGIPQADDVLGDPKAPVTLYEFADLQCPFCAQFAKTNLPLLLRDFVRTGKVKLVYQDMAFLGPDSEKAASAASAAGQQDRLWHFTNLFYWNQGEENTGYVTDAFLDKLYAGIPGLDAAKATQARGEAAASKPAEEARTLADRYGVSSTPSFVAGPTGGELQKLDASPDDYDALKGALDGLVRDAGGAGT